MAAFSMAEGFLFSLDHNPKSYPHMGQSQKERIYKGPLSAISVNTTRKPWNISSTLVTTAIRSGIGELKPCDDPREIVIAFGKF